MAELPVPALRFNPEGCPDCGERRVRLPAPLPDVGDDFDWRVRDYDGFRLFMLQELAARFPERDRWTPADLEVVIVEVLAAVLDQLSDMADRVASEAFLETARRPESIRRLLAMIGFDVVEQARDRGEILLSEEEREALGADPDPEAERRRLEEKLDAFWLGNPHTMELARREGPRAIHTQRRMVTVDDYARRLEDHPLVRRAHASSRWTGSWTTVRVAVINVGDLALDQPLPADSAAAVAAFHRDHDLPAPSPSAEAPPPTLRAVLASYLETFRMVGQEVLLEDALPVGISLSLSIRVDGNFYRSEVRQAIEEALGTAPGGFFEPGRLRFGEDLHGGDLIQALMSLDGVESVCLNRFKRLGGQFPDQAARHSIALEGLEVAVCDNDPARPARGYFRLSLHGGLKG